jgi:hypothetical protein
MQPRICRLHGMPRIPAPPGNFYQRRLLTDPCPLIVAYMGMPVSMPAEMLQQ